MNAGAPAARAGSVTRALVTLALPVLASQLLRLAFQWVDALWVRGLGVEATAAITTSVFVMWCVMSLEDIISLGLSAYVSQLIGAGERRRAGFAVWKGLKASAVLGLACAGAGLFGARAIFRVMDPGGHVVDAGAAYLRVVMLGAPFIFVALSAEVVMRACGDTRTPFLIDLGAVALNAVLAPLFIYGIGPFPRMGIAGAGLATVCAQVCMAGSYAVLAWRRHPSLPIARSADGPPVRVAALARVGLPAAAIGVLFSVVYVAFVRSASAFGQAAIAVVGIANRLEAVQFSISASLGIAGASLVGRSIGAGDPERAEATLRVGQRWSLGSSLLLMLGFLVFPAAFLRLFSGDPHVVELGVPYLRVLAFTLSATALEIVTVESILGSGHTVVVSWIFTTISLLRIPLAFLVPRWFGGGVLALAWLITVSCIVRSGVILLWAARGTWKRGLTHELRGGPAEPPAAG